MKRGNKACTTTSCTDSSRYRQLELIGSRVRRHLAAVSVRNVREKVDASNLEAEREKYRGYGMEYCVEERQSAHSIYGTHGESRSCSRDSIATSLSTEKTPLPCLFGVDTDGILSQHKFPGRWLGQSQCE